MSTHIPPEVVPVIRDAIARHPGGATIKDILAAFPEPPARRTLQRWLGNLAQAGELIPKAPDDPADPIRYLLPSTVASAGGQRSPDPVASVPDAGHGQRDPAVASVADDRRGQRSETVASDHGQRPADEGHANAGHALTAAQAAANPPLPNHGQRSPNFVASVPDAGHGQRNPAVASAADEPRGQRSDAVASVRGQRSADAGHADAGHANVGHAAPAPQPKPHRRKPAGASAGHAAETAADAPVEAAGAVVEAVVERAFGRPPKSGSPVQKRHRRTVPLVIATAVTAALLGWLGHLTWNVWTLSGAAVLAAIGAAVLAWESRQGSADSDPGSATSQSPVLRSLGGGGSAAAAWAAGGLGLVALVAAFLAYRQFRLRPTIGTVQAFVTSRLAPLPARVIALDVTFQAPGKAGVRLTYRAAIENTAPLYQTVATLSYLDNEPGHPLAALTSADLRLEGAAGDKLRSALGPAPTPDPRHVILLKPAVPIGTTAVASGTLVAWRTDNGWKFTIEQETLPRFAGEPRPTDKPSYDLDAPADAAAYASIIKNAVAYAAKVKEAADRTASSSAEPAKPTTEDRRQTAAPTADNNPVSRKEPKQAQENQPAKDEPGRATASAPRLAQSTAAPLPGQQTAAEGAEGDQRKTKGSEAAPAAGRSISASQHFSFSAFPTAPGAYALGAAGWTALPPAHTQKVQSTPQALTMKLQSLAYAEDAAIGRPPKPATDPIANVILTGADELPTVPAGELVLVYVGELKLPSATIMAKYPALKEYPVIELAPVQLAGGTTRYVPLYLVAPGALAYGPSRVPATVERPSQTTVVLRAHDLTPGTYALACGSLYYEVAVR